MSEFDSSKSPRVYKVLLMALPVGVVVGTIIFMFMYFYLEREDERNHAVIVSHGLRVSDLEDMVDKFTDRIGERDLETEQGRVGLKRAASMIEGRLGPQNVGYPVKKCEGQAAYGLLWKSLAVEIRGEDKPDEVVFAAVSYSGAGNVADANSVSTLMMLSASMAREKAARTLRFVFLPMNLSANEQKSWLIKRCLKPGESCAGIIGLKTMIAAPETGAEAWQAEVSEPADKAWWAYLSQGDSTGAFSGGRAPSVWLTNLAFSPETWVGNKDGRLNATLAVARELRTWLLMAAGVGK
jgi:hypothetical protein